MIEVEIEKRKNQNKMALFHLEVKIIGGKDSKRTATQAAAYRHRLKTDDGKDYSLKGGLVAEMFLTPKDFFVIPENLNIPDGADLTPSKIDPMKFWEAVDRNESQKRKDSRKAREVILSLHKELTLEENKFLVKKFVEDEFVSLGMTADIVIHRQPENPDNIHAHIMLTTRKAYSYGGFLFGFEKKTEREWNKKELVSRWREEWAKLSNSALKRYGKAITEKSYENLYKEAIKAKEHDLAEIYGQLMQCKTHESRFKQAETSKASISLAQSKKRLKADLKVFSEEEFLFLNGILLKNFIFHKLEKNSNLKNEHKSSINTRTNSIFQTVRKSFSRARVRALDHFLKFFQCNKIRIDKNILRSNENSREFIKNSNRNSHEYKEFRKIIKKPEKPAEHRVASFRL